jgi:hypothetical protein
MAKISEDVIRLSHKVLGRREEDGKYKEGDVDDNHLEGEVALARRQVLKVYVLGRRRIAHVPLLRVQLLSGHGRLWRQVAALEHAVFKPIVHLLRHAHGAKGDKHETEIGRRNVKKTYSSLTKFCKIQGVPYVQGRYCNLCFSYLA